MTMQTHSRNNGHYACVINICTHYSQRFESDVFATIQKVYVTDKNQFFRLTYIAALYV